MYNAIRPIEYENTRSSRATAVNRRANLRQAWLHSTALAEWVRVAILGAAGFVLLGIGTDAYALPTSGIVSAGAASISSTNTSLTVNQSTQNAAINWQSFGIAQGESVTFQQPNSSSVALNRVLGPDPSAILGSLTANGKVFLVNPNGILFAKGAQVNVGGLVASTLGITDANFTTANYKFTGSSRNPILNQGAINADGGYVALLGATVGNDGVITARLGSVTLAAGNAMTLDVAGNGLLNVTVNQGAVNALVRNGGLVQADGGQVVMTATSAGELLKSAVNNTGVIEARNVDMRGGTIKLLADSQTGTVNVSGTLDASAPNGGDGGSIETSGATVNVASDANITTAAATGLTGTWRIDPLDFVIGAGGNISGSTLSALLVTNSVDISTSAGSDATVAGTPPTTGLHTSTTGNGDITVNDAVSWTAAPSTTTLTLTADRDVNINNAITATNGNLVVCCGRDVNDNAAITTTNGSVLLSAGRDVNLMAVGAMATTDGNITICAGDNINVAKAITLTRGSTIPAQSLGLATGLVMIAGNGGTGPGVGGGTVIFAPLTPPVTVTGPNAPAVIDYNPVSYTTPTDYSTNFTLTGGATLTQHMLVFPVGDKVDDGSTATTLTGFKSTAVTGAPTGVTLVADTGATAVFDSATVGSNIGITYSGYSLGGANADLYALAANCCTPGFRTSGTITAAVVTPPVVTPPVVTPPVVTPPVVTPPVVTPPVVTPPVVTPPVVTPPVVTPPVVTPPVVTPPVVTPPVVTPPVVTPPVVTPPVVTPPVVTPPVVTPPVVTPPVVTPLAPPPVQLSSGSGFSPVVGAPRFAVLAGGVRMPPPPTPVVVAEAYVPPVYPPKQDRY